MDANKKELTVLKRRENNKLRRVLHGEHAVAFIELKNFPEILNKDDIFFFYDKVHYKGENIPLEKIQVFKFCDLAKTLYDEFLAYNYKTDDIYIYIVARNNKFRRMIIEASEDPNIVNDIKSQRTIPALTFERGTDEFGGFINVEGYLTKYDYFVSPVSHIIFDLYLNHKYRNQSVDDKEKNLDLKDGNILFKFQTPFGFASYLNFFLAIPYIYICVIDFKLFSYFEKYYTLHAQFKNKEYLSFLEQSSLYSNFAQKLNDEDNSYLLSVINFISRLTPIFMSGLNMLLFRLDLQYYIGFSVLLALLNPQFDLKTYFFNYTKKG